MISPYLLLYKFDSYMEIVVLWWNISRCYASEVTIKMNGSAGPYASAPPSFPEMLCGTLARRSFFSPKGPAGAIPCALPRWTTETLMMYG